MSAKERELISLTEAARRLGVSKHTLIKRLRETNVPDHRYDLDRRKRLFDWDELQRAFLPPLVIAAMKGTTPADEGIDAMTRGLMEREVGRDLKLVPSDDVAVLTRLLARGELDSFAAEGALMVDVLEGRGTYAARELGPFRVRDSFPGRIPGLSNMFVARADGPVKSIWDIRPGTRVARMGSPEPRASLVDLILLAWVDLDPSALEFVDVVGLEESAEALFAGHVDVCYAVPFMSFWWETSAAAPGTVWLDMNPAASERDLQGSRRCARLVPDWTFAPNEEGVPSSIGHWGIRRGRSYGCRFVHADADAELVYHVAKFRSHKSLVGLSKSPLEYARDALQCFQIPLHPGTIRLLEEEGIWDAAAQERQGRALVILDGLISAWSRALEWADKAGVRVDPANPVWMALWDECRRHVPGFYDLDR